MSKKQTDAPAADPGRLLTRAEAAQILSVRPNTLAVWACQRKGPPFVRISPAAIRYSERALFQWIAERSHITAEAAR